MAKSKRDRINSTKSSRQQYSARASVGTKRFVVVGIPAYNEENTIARVILQSQRFADKVVVCDDGSSDLTGMIAERLGAEVIQHERNMGYGAAIQSLFENARKHNADVLVTLDGDGQHNPSEIPKLVKLILQGDADIVIGSRLVGKQSADTMPWYRQAGVKLITMLTNGRLQQNGVSDAQSGFRAYGHKCLENLLIFENGMGISSEILINARKKHLKIREVTSSCNYYGVGRTSKHNPVRHGISVVASITKLIVEDRPLTMLGLPSILCLIVGAIFAGWMLQIYAVEHRIVTNIALASVAFILIGLFVMFTSITLYAIARLSRKMKKDN